MSVATDDRSPERRASDERIAAEPRLAPLDLPPDTPSMPMESHIWPLGAVQRKARLIHTEFTPEERDRWQRAVEEEQKARADNLARLPRLQAALEEDNISGQLRRAIVAGSVTLPQLASRAAVLVEALDDFMVGDAPLDSDALARVAAVLGYELTPVSASEPTHE